MKYQPKTGVWEITMRCNMGCKHCGSSCVDSQVQGELSTEEALRVCDELGEMGLYQITLSGGEPLMREDWPLLAARLRERGVFPNMISNGWYMTPEVARQAKKCGIANIAISLDGLEKTHDYMRRKGSWDRVMKALDIMREENLPSSIVTTLHQDNLEHLEEMFAILEAKGVFNWQLQIGAPMGNLASHPELLMRPDQVPGVIAFAHSTIKRNTVKVQLADCVGYYSTEEVELRKHSFGPDEGGIWQGCNAGRWNLGILCTGDITGCTSMRNRAWIEGNLRQNSLREIWERKGAFAWNRDFDASQLTGFCGRCQYGKVCQGGCPTIKLNFHGTMGENSFCAYRVAMEDVMKATPNADAANMIERAREAITGNHLQGAEILLRKALEMAPKSIEAHQLLGYVYYNFERFDLSKQYNEKALQLSPESFYAHKGLGLCYWRMGSNDLAVEHLKRAVRLAPANYADARHDLAIVYRSLGREQEAASVESGTV